MILSVPKQPTPMNSNLNRALLTWIDPSNGRTITVIANDDLRLSPARMQLWVDSMNQHLVTSGAYANGSRYHLG
jgi:hypothetical protein